MSRGRSLLFHVAAALALLLFALAPLWNAGLVGADLALFPADGSRLVALGPLGNASLELSRSLFGTPGASAGLAVRALRAENAVLLVLACLVLSALLRRTLRAWLGDEIGFAAQRAAVVLLPLHPWCLVAVATVRARGELLGLLLAALSALFFLRARHEAHRRWLVASLLLALAAGCASEDALLLAALLGVLEWIVARRHRSAAARVRTTLSTLLGFGAVTLLPLCAWSSPPAWTRPGSGLFGEWLGALGRVLVPLQPTLPDLSRAALGGAALLLALQPALVAARSAPRTWGRFALAWGLLELLLLAPAALGAARGEHDLADLGRLCFPALLLCAACATSATAHSGWKRTSFPWILALALLALGRPTLASWGSATRRLEHLAHELAGAGAAGAPEIVLLAPPESERGLELLPARGRPAWLARAAALPREPILLERAQLCAWSASASFPADLLLLQPAASSEPAFLADVLPATRRVQRRASAAERVVWRPPSRPVLDIDPQQLRCVRVRLEPGALGEGRPRLSWRSENGAGNASVEGVWIEHGESTSALFDLAREPRWSLCGRVRRVALEGEAARVASTEIVPALPEIALAQEPRSSGARWSARLAAEPLAEFEQATLQWQLVLFDPDTHEPCVLPGLARGGELEFADSAGWSAGRAHLEWSLEALWQRAIVARSTGGR